ncbi:MAG: hypothetical protein LBQ30_11275 [Treponema sp.]|jgi:hypothetical protein|nr:hypothetical protein [Treponema sp.]
MAETYTIMICKKHPAWLILRNLLFLLWFSWSPWLLAASPLASATWGFRLDLPEGYELTGGDGKDRFSFHFPREKTQFDLVVYVDTQPSVEALAADVQRRLNNQGKIDAFTYRHKKAVLMQLRFIGPSGLSEGWGICIELGTPGHTGKKPLLLALAYGPSGQGNKQDIHFSALDSIAPSPEDWYVPGPITEYQYPRGTPQTVPLAGGQTEAILYEHDAVAAQALVDREFGVLKRYIATPLWKEAWIRFYRAVYRDSFDRLAHAAFMLERSWNIPAVDNRDLAAKALAWVQSFSYERNLLGSDFVNLVSAVVEGRGDCDSRALLWALILNQANIPAAIMVSPQYSHAMGLADLPGTGARFALGGTQWLVAETTSSVSLGLISAQMSETRYWLGVTLE